METHKLLVVGLAFFFGVCSPKMVAQINKSSALLDSKANVSVVGLNDTVPHQSETPGTVDKAVPVVSNPEVGADYALLHIYRLKGSGFLVGYDLYLGDSVICRVQNNWKKTIRINKDGLNSIWAKTEVKKEIPVNIKMGKEYFIRCGVELGILVGRPQIEIVSKETGMIEYGSIVPGRLEAIDQIITKDGRLFECRIQSEDVTKVYFTIIKNGKQIKTQIDKSNIKEIVKGE